MVHGPAGSSGDLVQNAEEDERAHRPGDQPVFRAFNPQLVHFEQTSEPRVGMKVWCVKKVQYMEKLFAALLLCSPRTKQKVTSRILDRISYDARGVRGLALTTHPTTISVLKALQALLNFYLPAFLLGR